MANAEDDESEMGVTYSPEEYAAHMEERKTLIEAARESAKTFDQAVLAFGSAVFGASIAFLKDVAPHPQRFTLKWLGGAWFLFSAGLLAALMSFIWSHKACMSEIDAATATLGKPNAQRSANRWSALTDKCNYVCVGLLFLGLSFWSVFALENLTQGGNPVAQQSQTQLPQPYERVEKEHVSPKAPPTPPRTNQSIVPSAPQPTKKWAYDKAR
jgi:hypothetical protein